jgi:hypothetical protein
MHCSERFTQGVRYHGDADDDFYMKCFGNEVCEFTWTANEGKLSLSRCGPFSYVGVNVSHVRSPYQTCFIMPSCF